MMASKSQAPGDLFDGRGLLLRSMALLPLVPAGDAAEIRQDIQELFEELAASLPPGERGGAGECHPSVDVLETDETVEIFVDVAGVAARAVRVMFRGEVLVVVGEKAALRPQGPRTFHLVEREFGRFARAVRVPGAFDVSAARARVRDGELHVVLPKLRERRGQAHVIPVSTQGTQGHE
jgi:HSP20 family protein